MKRMRICFGKKNKKCYFVKRDKLGRIRKIQKINRSISADAKKSAKPCDKPNKGFECDYK